MSIFHRKLVNNKDEKNEGAARPIIRKSIGSNAVLTVTSLILLLNLTVNFLNSFNKIQKQEDSDLSSTLYFLMTTLFLTMAIHGSYKNYQETNRRSKKISDEIEHTKNTLSKVNHREWQDAHYHKLSLVETDKKAPFKAVYQDIFAMPKGRIASLRIDWEIGKGEIFDQLNGLVDLLEALQTQHIRISKHIKLPKAIQDIYSMRSFAPYCNAEFNLFSAIDFPTKLRALMYTILSPLSVARQMVDVLLGVDQASSLTYLGVITQTLFATASIVAAMIQSRYLSHELMQLNLEGFTQINRRYTDWPPTCIGQQLTREIDFYPSNVYFNDAVEFIYLTDKFLQKFKKTDEFQRLPADLQQKINDFKPLVKEYNPFGDYQHGLENYQRRPDDYLSFVSELSRRNSARLSTQGKEEEDNEILEFLQHRRLTKKSGVP